MEDLAAAVLRGQVSSPQKRTKEEKDLDKAMAAQEHGNIVVTMQELAQIAMQHLMRRDMVEASTKAAICQGLHACSARKQQLDCMDNALEVFGMQMSTEARNHLLESSLKLQSPSSLQSLGTFNASTICIIKQHDNHCCQDWPIMSPVRWLLQTVSGYVWGKCCSYNSNPVEGAAYECVTEADIRKVISSLHESFFIPECHYKLTPWARWTPQTHRHIVHNSTKKVVRLALLLLSSKNIVGDLAMHIIRFIFSSD
jgi:hypothetical protein